MKECWFVGAVLFYFQHHDNNGEVQFLAFVDVMKQHATAKHDKKVPIVKRHDPASTTSSAKYAVVNVNDITRQAGLVKFPTHMNQFYVIAPYLVFDTDMDSNAGNIIHL